VGVELGPTTHTSWPPSRPLSPYWLILFSLESFCCELNVHVQETVEFCQQRSILSFINPSTHPLPLTSLPKLLFILSLDMDPFNALSTIATARKIPPLREAPPAKVMSRAFVTSTDLERTLDATQEVTGGASAPLAKMAGQPTNSPDRPATVCGHSPPPPRDEGRSPLARQGSPCVRGHGTLPVHALSPRPTIGKEHRSVTPTHPTMGSSH
jgi:hypothetical protein